MEIVTAVDVILPRSLEDVWTASATLENLPKTWGAVAPIPGVRACEVDGGGQLTAGKVRIVHLTDGTTSREEILELIPRSRHRYKLVGLAPPFSWLVRWGIADWTFSAIDGGTRIQWSYTFTLTTPLAWPIARLAVFFFGRAMAGNLAGIRRLLGV